MSNSKKKKSTKRKKSMAKSVAGSAVGMIFNVVLIVVAAMLIYRFSISAYQYGIRIFGEPAMSESPGQEVVVTVTDGKDFNGIAETLYNNGLVRDKTLFVIQQYLSNYYKEGFTEGTHTLSTAMTPEELMDAMAENGDE